MIRLIAEIIVYGIVTPIAFVLVGLQARDVYKHIKEDASK